MNPQTKNCVRCAKRCRVAERRNPNANLFVKGDQKTGRFCAECVLVDFFKNSEHGPSSAFGKEYFDHSLPQPEWRRECGDSDRRFDPECLRLPHFQSMLRAILAAANSQYGAELSFDEIDMDEVIANWHLPFPERKRRKGK